MSEFLLRLQHHYQLHSILVKSSMMSSTMNKKRIVFTSKAPKPIGPYSQAVMVDNRTAYLSGTIGINVETGNLVTESIQAQAKQSFNNMKAVVEACGANMTDVIKVNIFITNFDDFPVINDVMKQFFEEPFPARSTIGVASLPLGAKVEIESIVKLEPKESEV